MRFNVDKHDKYVVIKLREAKFTNENTPALKSEFILLNTEGFQNIILDLSLVKECNDSQDLSALLTGDRLCKEAKGIFVVVGAGKSIRTIAKMSNIEQTVPFVNKLDEAIDLIFMAEIERDLLGD